MQPSSRESEMAARMRTDPLASGLCPQSQAIPTISPTRVRAKVKTMTALGHNHRSKKVSSDASCERPPPDHLPSLSVTIGEGAPTTSAGDDAPIWPQAPCPTGPGTRRTGCSGNENRAEEGGRQPRHLAEARASTSPMVACSVKARSSRSIGLAMSGASVRTRMRVPTDSPIALASSTATAPCFLPSPSSPLPRPSSPARRRTSRARIRYRRAGISRSIPRGEPSSLPCSRGAPISVRWER
jgi:hypothetical protein